MTDNEKPRGATTMTTDVKVEQIDRDAEIARLREALFKIHRASQSNRKDKLSRIEEIARNALQGDGGP